MRLAVVVIAFLLLAAPARADWNGDGAGDLLTIHPDGRLLMDRGNGAGGWLTGRGGCDRHGLAAVLAPGRTKTVSRPFTICG